MYFWHDGPYAHIEKSILLYGANTCLIGPQYQHFDDFGFSIASSTLYILQSFINRIVTFAHLSPISKRFAPSVVRARDQAVHGIPNQTKRIRPRDIHRSIVLIIL